MKGLSNIKHLYFIGIGGIGMSALARYCLQIGKTVCGYDRTPSQLTNELIGEGIDITFTDDPDQVDWDRLPKSDSLVVYTPAIPKDQKIYNGFLDRGYEVVKRAELLGAVTQDSYCLAVAGTHGKTTTSAILGHLLAHCDMPVTAFLGGIAENYRSNFINKGTKITVVEADEFDRSFMHLSPDLACITSMDADHLDIYGSAESLEQSFRDFAALLPDASNLWVRDGLPLAGRTVGVNSSAAYNAQNIRIVDGVYVFDLQTPETVIHDLEFILPGHHNLHNAVTALGMAIEAGTPIPCLPKALRTFQGVQRRFSYRMREPDMVLIDDYAHHPTEIDALHQAVTELYPNDRKLIVFQPHLYSRTQDFLAGFAQSLSRFDQVAILPIYPARELPIEGVNAQAILDRMNHPNAHLTTKENLPDLIRNSPCRIRVMAGAGDIGSEVIKITKYLQDENQLGIV